MISGRKLSVSMISTFHDISPLLRWVRLVAFIPPYWFERLTEYQGAIRFLELWLSSKLVFFCSSQCSVYLGVWLS